MSVNIANVALQPTGVPGPPEIMFGAATITGDVSGGVAGMQYILEAGFTWMPQLASIIVADVLAIDYELAMFDLEDVVPTGTFEWTQNREIAASTGIRTADALVLPRMLIRTTNKDSQVRFQTANVDTIVYRSYVRFLRWPKNAPPQAWQAFLTAPP